MISEKNPKIGAVGNSARLGPGGHVLAGDGASVIRRNAFSPDKGLSGENRRGGARTAAEQPPESKTWDFPKCAGAGGWRKQTGFEPPLAV